MFEHGLNTGFTWKTSFHWYLLTFLSGSVNAGGFLACERFVTHTTGFATLTGIALAKGEYFNALAMLAVPTFFLGGVMIAGILTENRRQQGLKPHYATTMALVAACLFAAALAGSFELFGIFGNEFYVKHDFVLIALLCLASGLQNAAITSSSGSTVRTTHLTGITTDLGLGLVYAFSNWKSRKKYRDSMKKNSMRFFTIASFIVGGSIGTFAFVEFHYLGFLLPAGLAVYATFIAKRYPHKEAVLGNKA